ncbi:MAG TPA: CPBP family intramembrane glutamic endopeptidase [Candidatus Dormibacteraeota bacterium]|nr:CPBP family intramembrane glutamic endopeptidase [Candidatus Dormibacteraeota bacterium]
MTAAAASIGVRDPGTVARWLAPAVVVLALGTIVGLRWWATRAGPEPLAVGAAFGLGLGAVATVRALRPGLPAARSIGIGIAVGLGLALITVAASSYAGLGVGTALGRPAAPFVPWAAITIVVATTEEAILRGRLFDAVRRAGGLVPTLIVTTIAFALMHVPLYGWHVVPLDLAVGLALGGLRLATGGIAAPAAAHAVADLATWWL